MKLNIFKKVILTISVGAVLVFNGCDNSDVQVKEGNEHFEKISIESIKPEGDLTIIKHKDSGKKFVIYNGYRCGGIAPLN